MKIIAGAAIDCQVQSGDAMNPVLLIIAFQYDGKRMAIVKSLGSDEAEHMSLALLRAAADSRDSLPADGNEATVN